MSMAAPAAFVRIFVLRHGERLDEANPLEWAKKATQEAAYDAPLTQLGWRQAEEAGRIVAAMLKRTPSSVLPPPVTVYSSPTSRTLSTASAVAKLLGVPDIVPAFALNCCAAAKEYGVIGGFPKTLPADEVLGSVPLRCWPPIGDAAEIDRIAVRSNGFVQTVRDLAGAHNGGDAAVLVTHREGIWELLEHLGLQPSAKYCCVKSLAFDKDSGELLPWEPGLEITAPAAAEESAYEAWQELPV